jgi:hypothetical protein
MRSPLTGFVALLRAAGLAIPSERLLLAEQALNAVGRPGAPRRSLRRSKRARPCAS